MPAPSCAHCPHDETEHDGCGCTRCSCPYYEAESEPEGDGTFEDAPPKMEFRRVGFREEC